MLKTHLQHDESCKMDSVSQLNLYLQSKVQKSPNYSYVSMPNMRFRGTMTADGYLPVSTPVGEDYPSHSAVRKALVESFIVLNDLKITNIDGKPAIADRAMWFLSFESLRRGFRFSLIEASTELCLVSTIRIMMFMQKWVEVGIYLSVPNWDETSSTIQVDDIEYFHSSELYLPSLVLKAVAKRYRLIIEGRVPEHMQYNGLNRIFITSRQLGLPFSNVLSLDKCIGDGNDSKFHSMHLSVSLCEGAILLRFAFTMNEDFSLLNCPRALYVVTSKNEILNDMSVVIDRLRDLRIRN